VGDLIQVADRTGALPNHLNLVLLFVAVEFLPLLSRILEVLCSHIDQEITYPKCFRGFPQILFVNAETLQLSTAASFRIVFSSAYTIIVK
jgi:hypothetical protein